MIKFWKMISVKATLCREAYEKKNLMFSTSFCNCLREKHLHGDLGHFLVQHLASVIFFSDTSAELSSFLYINTHKSKLKKKNKTADLILNVKLCNLVREKKEMRVNLK